MASENSGITTGQPNLQKQDLSKLDVAKLTALSQEVISRQATINIGTIGHVAHGKSTVVKAISGVQTVRFKNELERNITIKLERLQFDVNGDILNHNQKPSKKRKRKDSLEAEKGPEHVANMNNRTVYAKEYVVEKIMGYRMKYGCLNFNVKWQGWSEECNTWEPIRHLEGCPSRLEEFCTEHFNQEVLDSLCKQFSVSSDFSEKSLESLLPLEGFSRLKPKLKVQEELLTIMAVPPENHNKKKLKRAKETLLLYFLYLKRDKQLSKLTKWEESINAISMEKVALKVENNVDLEGPPCGFHYVNDYVPTNGIKIPNNPPIGCECVTCLPKEKDCCGRIHSHKFSYRDNAKINVSKGTPIYECNKMCLCDANCRNRVVQHGRNVPLSIFRTSNGCGWGVKTLKKIYNGEFVCEYVGEVITHEEAEKRGEIYDAEGRTYLFDLDFNMSDNPYTIDAATYGNVSHFINHSCDPNLGVWAVWINCLDPNIPKLALFATKEIQKDEEITFDYMSGNKYKMNTKGSSKAVFNNGLQLSSENVENTTQNRPICKCGAKTCRQYLF